MPGFVTLDNGESVYREHTPSGPFNSVQDSEQIYYGNIARIGRMITMNKKNPGTYTERDIRKEITDTAGRYEIAPKDYEAEIDLYLESQETNSEPSTETNKPQM